MAREADLSVIHCTLASRVASSVGSSTLRDLITKKGGSVFRVGIFLDFVRLTTRTMHPHGAYVWTARRNRIEPHGGGIERPTTHTPVRLHARRTPMQALGACRRAGEIKSIPHTCVHFTALFHVRVWRTVLHHRRERDAVEHLAPKTNHAPVCREAIFTHHPGSPYKKRYNDAKV